MVHIWLVKLHFIKLLRTSWVDVEGKVDLFHCFVNVFPGLKELSALESCCLFDYPFKNKAADRHKKFLELVKVQNNSKFEILELLLESSKADKSIESFTH